MDEGNIRTLWVADFKAYSRGLSLPDKRILFEFEIKVKNKLQYPFQEMIYFDPIVLPAEFFDDQDSPLDNRRLMISAGNYFLTADTLSSLESQNLYSDLQLYSTVEVG